VSNEARSPMSGNTQPSRKRGEKLERGQSVFDIWTGKKPFCINLNDQ
jgi:hypothetical protein